MTRCFFRIVLVEVSSHEVVSINQQTASTTTTRSIQLGIAEETGQLIRQLSLGNLSPQQQLPLHINHVTDSAVSLTLRASGQSLGRHTITVVDLRECAYEKQSRVFTFARNDSHVYKLHVRVEFVRFSYTFILDRVTCLSQNRWFSPDPLYAQVQFNYSAHNTGSLQLNTYQLGYYKQHEASGAYTSHNLSFSAMNAFLIRFTTNQLLVLKTVMDDWRFRIICHEDEEYFILKRKLDPDSSQLLRFNLGDQISHEVTIKCATCSYQLKFTISRTQLPTYDEDIAPYRTHNARFHEDAFTKDYLQKISGGNGSVTSQTFTSISSDNEVEMLIDGLQTFGRYYHYMMQAQETIDILAWELSLSFGLVFAKKDSKLYRQFQPSLNDLNEFEFSAKPRDMLGALDPTKYNDYLRLLNRLFQSSFSHLNTKGRWIRLHDVLLTKAASGVKVRLIVWRHRLLSYLTKFLYLGEVTIEREAQKLRRKAKKMGLTVKIFHTDFDLPNPKSSFADPNFRNWTDETADIVLVIVGNPKGMVSSHHEKLLLIDAEKPDRCVSFIGGFDIARGRYDQPLHLPPLSTWTWGTLINQAMKRTEPQDFGDDSIQPFLRNIRLLWHDNQVMVRGSATRIFHLHFIQRWVHAFTGDNHTVRALTLPQHSGGEPMTDPEKAVIHSNVTLRVLRSWPGVLATHTLLDNFCNLIRNAQDYLYIEHQYPFHNISLTQCLCEALQRNQKLKVLMIVPVRTDLPTGMIGRYFDASQDQIDDHLRLIYSVAPERVGVYGLVTQDPKSRIIKSIYVHSKLLLVDDMITCTGSANMDTLSFYRSSEFNVNLYNEQITKETRVRLAREHLEDRYTDEMTHNFNSIFHAFREVGEMNSQSLKTNGVLSGRIFPLVPLEQYRLITTIVNYPGAISKAIFKLGLSPDVIIQTMLSNARKSVESEANEATSRPTQSNFFIYSNL